jgi:hypothetical protein
MASAVVSVGASTRVEQNPKQQHPSRSENQPQRHKRLSSTKDPMTAESSGVEALHEGPWIQVLNSSQSGFLSLSAHFYNRINLVASNPTTTINSAQSP